MKSLPYLLIGLMFIPLSMVTVYQPSQLVLGLGIAALLISVVLAYLVNAPKDTVPKSLSGLHANALRLLLMFTWMVSVVSAGFVGKWLWELYGLLLAPLVWTVVFFFLFKLLWDKLLTVPGGTLLVLRSVFGTQTFAGPQKLFPPLPHFEGILAKMPLTELKSNIHIANINTKELYDIKSVDLLVRYQLRKEEWFKVFSLPNRFTLFSEVMSTMKGSGNHMENPAFWQALFDHLVQKEVDYLVRDIIFRIDELESFVKDIEHIRETDKSGFKKGELTIDGRYRITSIELYRHRDHLAKYVFEMLQEPFGKWGLELKHLDFLNVELAPERVKAYTFDREAKSAEHKAKIAVEIIEQRLRVMTDAKAEAIHRAMRAIGEGLHSFKDQGIELTQQEIQEIVRTAMQEITVILRLGNDLQERINPAADLPLPGVGKKSGSQN